MTPAKVPPPQKPDDAMQGHTSFINCVRYLPSRNNEYIVSASNDKEVTYPE